MFIAKLAIELLIAFSALGVAKADNLDARTLQKGMPKDVATFIERTDECNHWGGEEPFDAARAKQIERAVKKLKCSKLQSDEKKLRKKYRYDPKVLKVLDQVKDL